MMIMLISDALHLAITFHFYIVSHDVTCALGCCKLPHVAKNKITFDIHMVTSPEKTPDMKF